MLKRLFLCLAAFAALGLFAQYQVTVIGDVHFDGPSFHTGKPINQGRAKERKRNFAMWQGPSDKLLEAAAKTGAKSAFAIQLGDICQGDADTPELQEKLLAGAFAAVKRHFPKMPLLVVKGNHDVRVFRTQNDPKPYHGAMLPLVAKELGAAKLEDGNYAYRKGPDLFIAVDGFVGPKPLLAFVKRTLEANADARYVFLLTHLPVLPVGVGNPLWRLPAADEIAALLEKRNAIILAAHTHRFSIVERKSAKGRLVQLITTSMGNAWNPTDAKLEVLRDWPAFLAEMEKALSASEKGRKTLATVKKVLALGEFTGRFFAHRSGFTVLDIDDRRVEARIFNGEGATPARVETLATAAKK